MLLNIERVLKMLAGGKSAEKIADTSGVSVQDVYDIIGEALKIVMEHDRQRARKKVLLKKDRTGNQSDNNQTQQKEIFEGAELSAVPLESVLTMYTDGASSGNPGHAGIGIVIYDTQNRQVGKLSRYIGIQTNNYAEYTAVITALEIARYFNVRECRIRTDSELVVKQLTGIYKVKNENIRELYEKAVTIKKQIKSVRLEHVTRSLNDKADHLAKKAAESYSAE